MDTNGDMARKKKLIPKTIDEIENACKNTYSIAGALKFLGLVPHGGNYKRIHRIIDDHNIDTSHFTGMGWNVGNVMGLKNNQKKFSDEEVFKNSTEYKGTTCNIKKRLSKYKNINRCEMCGITKWNNEDIVMELHHINGDNNDNRFENLQILCPNCHSQTHNFRGRNIKNK